MEKNPFRATTSRSTGVYGTDTLGMVYRYSTSPCNVCRTQYTEFAIQGLLLQPRSNFSRSEALGGSLTRSIAAARMGLAGYVLPDLVSWSTLQCPGLNQEKFTNSISC
jgi:hypothetical protein